MTANDQDLFEPPTWMAVTRWVTIAIAVAAAVTAVAAVGSLVLGPALS